jgi:uncharacterized surface protein with fasciclin (FAS1) repeats
MHSRRTSLPPLLSQEALEALLADKEKLTAVLTYHVIPGKVGASLRRHLDVLRMSGADLSLFVTTGRFERYHL